DGRPRGTGALDRRASQSAEAAVGRREVSQPRPERLAGADGAGDRIEVGSRREGGAGFVKLPRRWVVERTYAWLGRYRRHSRDYERFTDSSEAMIQVSSIHRMLRLLKPDPSKAI